MTSRVAFIAAAAVLLACSAPARAALPTGFEGHWTGNTTYTPMGPLTTTFNFSILPVAWGRGNVWLMSDVFDGYLGRTSSQQFWVQSNDDGTKGNLTYCGILRNFYDVPGRNVQTVQVWFELKLQNATRMHWYMGGPYWTGDWVLNLEDKGRTLRSTFSMPAGTAEHFHATYRRAAGDASPYVPASVRAAAAEATTTHHFNPPCNSTWSDAAAPAVVAAAPATANEPQPADVPVCPRGYTAADGPMPPFVKKLLKARQEAKAAAAVAEEAAAAAQAAQPKPRAYNGRTYEHCWLINPALNFTMRYTWNISAQTAHVLFSMSPPRNHDGTAFNDIDVHNMYAAVGVMPNFPGMQNMDIVMGHFAGPSGGACVRSMYAKWYVGTPVDDPLNQTITDTALWHDGHALYVQYTRPWNTGHHDLNNTNFQGIPSISFAVGRAPSNCSASPHYHGWHRGTYGFMFPQPDAVPAFMKCD